MASSITAESVTSSSNACFRTEIDRQKDRSLAETLMGFHSIRAGVMMRLLVDTSIRQLQTTHDFRKT
jgi:hypothetical protein